MFLRKISCVEVTNLPAAFCIQKRNALARNETAKEHGRIRRWITAVVDVHGEGS